MEKKWQAKVSTKLERARPDQIWPLFHDFFGLDKWFPSLAICYGVHGVNGEPGCIRRCSGFGLKREEIDKEGSLVSWSEEKLVSIDHDQMSLTYEILDSNIGFKGYVANVKVVPAAEGGGGAAVEWRISLDPVAGWKLEDLVVKYEMGLRLMVKKMEDSVVLISD